MEALYPNYRTIKKILRVQREVERLNKDRTDDFVWPDEVKPIQRFLHRRSQDDELRPVTMDYLSMIHFESANFRRER
jgi:hypothetical protein